MSFFNTINYVDLSYNKKNTLINAGTLSKITFLHGNWFLLLFLQMIILIIFYFNVFFITHESTYRKIFQLEILLQRIRKWNLHRSATTSNPNDCLWFTKHFNSQKYWISSKWNYSRSNNIWRNLNWFWCLCVWQKKMSLDIFEN